MRIDERLILLYIVGSVIAGLIGFGLDNEVITLLVQFSTALIGAFGIWLSQRVTEAEITVIEDSVRGKFNQYVGDVPGFANRVVIGAKFTFNLVFHNSGDRTSVITVTKVTIGKIPLERFLTPIEAKPNGSTPFNYPGSISYPLRKPSEVEEFSIKEIQLSYTWTKGDQTETVSGLTLPIKITLV